LRMLTTEAPLIVVLEDLHWSDFSTLDLLASLARRRDPLRLLLIGTYRPVDVIISEHPLKAVKQELQVHGQCTEVPLNFFTADDVVAYLATRLVLDAAGLSLARKLAPVLYRRTGGNPLFLTTVVNDLIARKVIIQRQGQWRLQDEGLGADLSIPESIRQMIEKQVERLSPEEQKILEAASVVGVEFATLSVADVLGREELWVEEHCEQLARRGQLIRPLELTEWPDGSLTMRYQFSHVLYQNVVYDQVGAARRIRFHHRVGEREEQAYGERARERAVELARHFELGRDYRRAVQYLRQAGENALRRVAHQEAIRLLRRGLELLKILPDTPERLQQELRLQLTLAVPLMTTKGYAAPEVESAYARAREIGRQVGETPLLLPVLWGLWGFYLVRGDLSTARELAEQGRSLVLQTTSLDFRLGVHLGLGTILYYCGELAAAQSYLEQGVTLYDPDNYRLDRSDGFVQDSGVGCLSYGAHVSWLRGYPAQARGNMHDALTLAEDLSHPFSLAYVLNHAAALSLLRREPQRTQELAGRAVTLATEHGFLLWTAMGTILGGWALSELGHWEEGAAQILHGLDVFRATGAGLGLPFFLALLAEVYEKGGQLQKSEAVLAEAFTIARGNAEHFYEAELYRLKGELLLRSRNLKANPKDQPPTA
jgi:predicted ATPase